MAYVGTTNISANNTTGLALYTLKETLKLAGWTVLASGTGTAGSTAASDLITTGTGTAIGSFARASAWVRIREPSGAGGREYILQNANADNSPNVSIKYSRSTGFTSGGTATVAPTTGGGDGIVWIGGGTDAAPTAAGAAWLPGAATGYYHAVANTVAVNGVYGFWWYGYTAAGATVTLIGTEAVAPGSTAANDNDPSIRYRNNLLSGSTASNTISWWEAYGLAGQVYRTGGFLCLYGTSLVGAINWPGSTGSLSPYTGTVPMFSHLVGASGVIPKGFTTEVVSLTTVQNVCDTFNLSTSNPKINFGTGAGTSASGLYGGVAFPWVTSVVPLV